MKNKKPSGEFTLEQYQAIAAEIDEKTFEYLWEQVNKLLPASHSNYNALYYILLRLATRTICVICENDKEAKKKAVADFCETLPKMVNESRVIFASTDASYQKPQ